MRVAILALLLAGCDVVLGLDKNPPTPADAAPCRSNAFGSDTEMLAMFDRYETEGTSMTVNGELVEASRVPAGYASVQTNGTALDFSNATARVRIVRRVDPPNAESFFSLHADDDHYYYYSIDEGLGMGRKQDGQTALDLKQLVFEPQAHVWLRFRHEPEPSDDIVFETSIDGTNWVERHRIDVKFDLQQVRLRIGAGTYGAGQPKAATGVFDDFEFCR